MDDIRTSRALAIPAGLTALTIGIAAAISLHTGVSGGRVFAPYVGAWAASTVMAVLIWIFVQVAIQMPTRADNPVRIVLGRLGKPVQLAALPAIIFPLFLSGYTWAKCSIPFAVGYGWESIWADADYALFGTDAWRLAHSLIPASLAPAWSFFYAVIWGLALLLSGVAIAVFASRRAAATFFTAMMLSWLIGGIAMAYAISAAGPVFAHLADPNLAGRFMPLRAELAQILPQDDFVIRSQRYLVAAMEMRAAIKGGGISAMPSMHIATVTILMLAAGRTLWLVPAALFAALTFIGSIYVGYHYAVDAPVAAAVAVACWLAARRLYRAPGKSSEPAKVGGFSLARRPAGP